MTRLDFDYEEYFNELFANTAVMMWSTHLPAVTFAFYINRLYDKQLTRRESITLHTKKDESRCSVFTQQDNLRHTTYMLIDDPSHRPSARSTGSFFDKTLLIMGPDAHQLARDIYDDMESTPLLAPTDSDDAHTLLRQTFLASGVLEYALFNFADPNRPRTTYFTSQSSDPRIQERQRQFLRRQREYVCDLLLALDSLLPNYESEE